MAFAVNDPEKLSTELDQIAPMPGRREPVEEPQEAPDPDGLVPATAWMPKQGE